MRRKTSEKLNIAGPAIRRLRRSNDWTQKEFAKLLREAGWEDCSRRWISKLESGEATLRDVDLPYLRAVLGESFTNALATLITKVAEATAARRREPASLPQFPQNP